jgi:GT2 family glycosyltransferase
MSRRVRVVAALSDCQSSSTTLPTEAPEASSCDSQAATVRVLVAIINYNSADDAIETVRSIQAQTLPQDAEFDLELIDNGSTDDCYRVIACAIPDLRVARYATNLGYAGRINQVLQNASSMHYDHVVICNNDIELNNCALANLLETAGMLDAGLVGGVEYCYYTGVVRAVAGTGYSLWDSRARWLRSVSELPAAAAQVAFVQGSLLLFTSRALAAGLNVDEKLFMYGEEVDLGYQLARHGLRAYVDTRVCIRHKAKAHPLAISAGYYLQRNRLYLVRKYGKLHHILFYVLYLVTLELPAKLALRTLQGRFDYSRACFAGFVDALAGRMGIRPHG